MPLARTAFGPFWFNGTSTANAQTTSSFTPTSNSLLVVAVSAVDQNDAGQKIGSNLTLTDSLSSTWTKRVQGTDAARYGTATVIWTTPITTGASMTLTFDCGAVTVHSALVSVYCYTGHNTVGATANGSNESGIGAFSMSMTDAPAASSEVLAIAATCQGPSGTYGPTTGSGWTQINLQGNLGWIGVQVQSRTNSTSSTVAWADMSGTNYGSGVDNPYCFQAVAIEIKEALLDQTRFRWRNDDGSQTAATWAAAENAAITKPLG